MAEKYDVENLSPEEKEKLSAELKDKGVLEEEYRITNFVFIPLESCLLEGGGKITIGEHEAFDLEDTNWLKKYDDIANYCDSLLDILEDDDSRKESIENICNIYLKIGDIFDKIAEAIKKESI